MSNVDTAPKVTDPRGPLRTLLPNSGLGPYRTLLEHTRTLRPRLLQTYHWEKCTKLKRGAAFTQTTGKSETMRNVEHCICYEGLASMLNLAMSEDFVEAMMSFSA